MSMFSEENKHVVEINYLTPDEKKNLLSAICAKYILYVKENQRNLLRHLPLRPENIMQIRLNSCKRVLFSAVLRLQGVDENSCKKWMRLNILYNYQSTTTDCWISRQTKGYMTVTLHFINAQWQLHSRVLSTSTTLVEGSDDAQNLAPGMQKVFQARGISEKVKTITSDNSPN